MYQQELKYDKRARNSKGSAGPSNTSPADGPMMKPGLELHQGGLAGRDPRKMTQDDLREAGHEPMSPLQAVRAHCLDCCGHQETEVVRCTAVKCPSWPFRLGTNPWRKPPSEARREAARQAMTNLNARRQKRKGAGPPASPPDHGIAPALAEGSDVAPIWTTARVDEFPDAELHRDDGSAKPQTSDQFPDDGVIIAPAASPNGSVT